MRTDNRIAAKCDGRRAWCPDGIRNYGGHLGIGVDSGRVITCHYHGQNHKTWSDATDQTGWEVTRRELASGKLTGLKMSHLVLLLLNVDLDLKADPLTEAPVTEKIDWHCEFCVDYCAWHGRRECSVYAQCGKDEWKPRDPSPCKVFQRGNSMVHFSDEEWLQMFRASLATHSDGDAWCGLNLPTWPVRAPRGRRWV